MDNPTEAVFEAIEEAAKQAIQEAADLPDVERHQIGAVNWADIGVVDVVFCRNRAAETWFEVELEEASPGCGLGAFVADHLGKTFPDAAIRVRTQW